MNLPKASPRSMEKFSLLMKHVQSSSPRVRILLLSSLILFFFGFAYLYLFSDLFNNNNNNEWNSNLNYSSIFPNLSAKTSPENRIAICLCGGLRQFELTAPTIQKHILSTYANAADVYIVSPFDDTSGKLWVLSDSQVVALHFVKQFDFPADDIMNAVLLDQWKTGRQGLLRYAELVERCSHLIRMHEFKHGFEYKWILRTRPDTLWRENAPPLDSLSAEELYIPYANDWYGINDRLSLGSREWSMKAMEWVSVLPRHYREGRRDLTAEPKYEELLKTYGLIQKVKRSNFSFCVLTKHTFSYPIEWFGEVQRAAPVSPLNASGSGDGRYCRPCIPKPDVPIEPDFALKKFHTDLFCNSSDAGFNDGWEAEFDEMFGAKAAETRKRFLFNDNFWSCTKLLGDFLVKIEIVEGERDPYVICARRYGQS